MAICIYSPRRELGMDKNGKKYRHWTHTTLAALATTSKSVGIASIVTSTHATSEGERRAMSRRHSVASARKIDNDIKRELYTHESRKK